MTNVHPIELKARPIDTAELTPAYLRSLTNTMKFKRTDGTIDAALRAAADRIEAQSQIIENQGRLIGAQRVALQPFAVAAPCWQGHDDLALLEGRGHQIKLGHFRQANKLWRTR